MILFHAITTYHLLEAMVYRLLNCRDEEFHCLLPDFFLDKFSEKTLDFIVKNGIFDKIIYFPYLEIRHETDTILSEMDKRISEQLGDISNYDEIHVAGAQYYFSHWLINNNIPFVFWEEASGALTKSDALKGIVQRISAVQHTIALENNMYDGTNPLVEKTICNFGAQSLEFIPEQYNAQDFNVSVELMKLPERDLQMILDFFNVPAADFEENSVLILTQHFANLRMMTFEEQAALYQTTVDYYLDGYNVVFKTHPDDLMFYDMIVPKCKIISESFPSELLPFVTKRQAEVIAAVSSTGIRNISQFYEKMLNFDPEYEHSFERNHQYYFSLKLAQKFGLTLHGIGVNELQMQNMAKWSDAEVGEPIIFMNELRTANASGNLFLIDSEEKLKCSADELWNFLDSISYNDIVCFLNSTEGYFFYDYKHKQKLMENLIVKDITISKRKESVYADLSDKKVYLYTKSKKFREEIQHMNYEKELNNTGIKTKISDMSAKDVEIAVLKGVLAATEKRLLYYIEKERETGKEEN